MANNDQQSASAAAALGNALMSLIDRAIEEGEGEWRHVHAAVGAIDARIEAIARRVFSESTIAVPRIPTNPDPPKPVDLETKAWERALKILHDAGENVDKVIAEASKRVNAWGAVGETLGTSAAPGGSGQSGDVRTDDSGERDKPGETGNDGPDVWLDQGWIDNDGSDDCAATKWRRLSTYRYVSAARLDAANARIAELETALATAKTSADHAGEVLTSFLESDAGEWAKKRIDELERELASHLEHGVHTEATRQLADALGMREGKHAVSSVADAARRQFEDLSGRFETETRERVRCRDGWAKAKEDLARLQVHAIADRAERQAWSDAMRAMGFNNGTWSVDDLRSMVAAKMSRISALENLSHATSERIKELEALLAAETAERVRCRQGWSDAETKLVQCQNRVSELEAQIAVLL